MTSVTSRVMSSSGNEFLGYCARIPGKPRRIFEDEAQVKDDRLLLTDDSTNAVPRCREGTSPVYLRVERLPRSPRRSGRGRQGAIRVRGLHRRDGSASHWSGDCAHT